MIDCYSIRSGSNPGGGAISQEHLFRNSPQGSFLGMLGTVHNVLMTWDCGVAVNISDCRSEDTGSTPVSLGEDY